ncbi:uncharacterized protein BYT42DRAFT_559234 [Radiomyces spectabilis]|uniref:uncharacterized protein n=1 Tax=Radiomyces spectabilis TaxID=64574 RepID=UPI00221E7966|nr:uncharacterized protein BYT42DRAFT_559234 [Radiomyces spectabilis]KAI8388199.1 hypothetical protein BYT42DRAFT_559234 [Radiomyces spectabilis]
MPAYLDKPLTFLAFDWCVTFFFFCCFFLLILFLSLLVINVIVLCLLPLISLVSTPTLD